MFDGANLFLFGDPPTNMEYDNIMIWNKIPNDTKYSTIDNFIWDSPSNINKKITIYEASYVNIDYLLTHTQNKNKFKDLSNTVTSLRNRISTIEKFLQGVNPPAPSPSSSNPKNYYLGLANPKKNPNNKWSDISNDSIWRQFI